MKRARAKESRIKKKLTVFLVAFLAVCTVFVLALGFHSVLFPMTDDAGEELVIPVDKATGKVNVLLAGVDADEMRTDTIIVASYDLDNGTVNMLSVPRDTRMYIGKKWQKINSAYSISSNGKMKGVQGTIEAVTRLTGIPINYYVVFSCEAFRNTIDALGGVEFDVPQRMYYQDPAQDLYIDLQAGRQHLDGDKAEQLVRFRKYPGGDIDRVKVQQQFVKAVAEQKLKLEIITKLPEIYKVLKEDVKTNFTIADIAKYIPNLKELSAENVTMYQLPGTFSGSEYKASYWLANMTELKELIETVFEYDASGIMTGIEGKTDPGGDKKTTAANTTKQTPKPTTAPKSTATPKSDNASETEKETPKPTSTPEPSDKSDSEVIQLD